MTDPNQAISWPLLIRFSKSGLMRFVGHLDWQSLQQAMFIKAGLKISIGDGPTHKLKMKTSPPTPVGVSSRAEFTYLQLFENIYPDEAVRRLSLVCPDGIEVVSAMDAGRLVRKNPFGAIEASGYEVDFGDGVSDDLMGEIYNAFEQFGHDVKPDDVESEDVKQFWGRVMEVDTNGGKLTLLVRQLEGETFHGARCAGYLESSLKLPNYPIFTKMDYYRLKPSKRKLYQ